MTHTPTRWVQFHPDYCPEALGTQPREWDSSHDISEIRADGSRYRIGHMRHADDAGKACLAVNAHDALVKALEEIALHTDIVSDTGWASGLNSVHLRRMLGTAHKTARAALALAKGETE